MFQPGSIHAGVMESFSHTDMALGYQLTNVRIPMHNRNFSEKDDGVWEMAERQEMREWKIKCNNMAVHLSRMKQ